MGRLPAGRRAGLRLEGRLRPDRQEILGARARGQTEVQPGRAGVRRKEVISGEPDRAKICTSYIERSNLTLRNHCKRLARLTLAFSKKLENFKAAVALNLAYYNFVKTHTTLRCTPAEEAGIIETAWTTENLVDAV